MSWVTCMKFRRTADHVRAAGWVNLAATAAVSMFTAADGNTGGSARAESALLLSLPRHPITPTTINNTHKPAERSLIRVICSPSV